MTVLNTHMSRLEECRARYIGKDLPDLPKPAAVLDVAKARKHCSSMLEAARALQVDFRAHVKTHKTAELAKMQVGENAEDAKFIVSTVAELEHLLPMLIELQGTGCKVNVLYGVPLPPSAVNRVAQLGSQLGSGTIAFMLDHPSQLAPLRRFHELAGFAGGAFLKIDTGYHRAGLPPTALDKDGLLDQIFRLETQGLASLTGIYSHSSLSYQDSTSEEAMDNLAGEIEGCITALRHNRQHFINKGRKLVISVGASPQVTSIQNFTSGPGAEKASQKLRQAIQDMSAGEIDGVEVKLELHAGVYSVLDLQQLATNSRGSLGGCDDEIAVSVVAEVVSVYNNGERHQPEVLIAVGTLGLGREPCHAYKGWGVISPKFSPELAKLEHCLVVERISQEHAILAWESSTNSKPLPAIPLEVGQTVRIYPNHACVTGAMYDWYYVVDSSEESSEKLIVDIWARASGW
ncbi:putative serine dehydratase domain-containing protein [Ilyonectria destructans]|nr:putative serine dehydratase domain-containing protein [Ilyonectria destructans]